VQANIQERKRNQPNDGNNNEKSRYGFSVEPKTYTKLGHLHLLLGDYSKALSAYQKYFRLSRSHWKDPCFLYGLGLYSCYLDFAKYLI
jgi:lysine-specific demethylase 6A